MAKPRMPAGLGARGKKLWTDLVKDDMPADQASLLVETCRVADRLEDLDKMIRGEGVVGLMLSELEEIDDGVVEVRVSIDDVLMESRQQQNLYKQLLVTVRQLAPGAKVPVKTSRGAYSTRAAGGKVSGIEEAPSAGRGWRGA